MRAALNGARGRPMALDVLAVTDLGGGAALVSVAVPVLAADEYVGVLEYGSDVVFFPVSIVARDRPVVVRSSPIYKVLNYEFTNAEIEKLQMSKDMSTC